MNPAIPSNKSTLSPATSAFALAAAVTFLFNTALAWAKDAYPALNNGMKSLTGHHWTTHGLADLAIFLGLGFVFLKTGLTANMNGSRVTNLLIGAVVVATLGLALWYVVT